MDKTLGQIGRHAYNNGYDSARRNGANGAEALKLADEACAAAVVRAFLERDALWKALVAALYTRIDQAPQGAVLDKGYWERHLAAIQEARRG